MRSSRLITALAAGSALLVLAPAGAAARPASQKHLKANPNGPCKVTLAVEPRTVTSGEAVELTGQLLCNKGITEGQPVAVFERIAGSSTFKSVATTTTASGGLYKVASPPVTADSWFYVRTPTRRSPTKAVRVEPSVTLEGPPTAIPLETGKKHAVKFTGKVNPADEGAEVWLEREQATSTEEWGVIQKTTVKAGGSFEFLHAFGIPGVANFRALVRPHGIFDVRGVSSPIGSYVINQVQNPNLTIKSSADPISYGAPITIEGVLKGGAGKTVTLLSHAKGISTFSPVATAVAGPGGEYKFPQAPLINTSYRTTGGGQTSAVLVEGVKYLLTAGVNATKVLSGQALTFSGTVTPPHKGKVVFLERENLFGHGFHVADGAEVHEVNPVTGTYLLEHVFHGSGKQVFRIHVPGDNENQGVSSAAFTIEVMPSPPTLHPVVKTEKKSR
jgi:hypothetical protein